MILGPDGKEVPKTGKEPCPRCGASSDKRVASGGFGEAHMVCSNCAYEFKEQKCQPVGNM